LGVGSMSNIQGVGSGVGERPGVGVGVGVVVGVAVGVGVGVVVGLGVGVGLGVAVGVTPEVGLGVAVGEAPVVGLDAEVAPGLAAEVAVAKSGAVVAVAGEVGPGIEIMPCENTSQVVMLTTTSPTRQARTVSREIFLPDG